MGKHCGLSLQQQAQHPIGAPVQVLAAPLAMDLPVKVPGRAAEDGASTWAPDEAADYWFPLAPLWLLQPFAE